MTARRSSSAKPKPIKFSSADPIFREALKDHGGLSVEELIRDMEYIRLGHQMDSNRKRQEAFRKKFNAAMDANDFKAALLAQADGIRVDQEWDELYRKRFGRTPDEARAAFYAEQETERGLAASSSEGGEP